ncbi:MAG TPA: SLBB domain-containing protein [Steroidobacteraceae bacterium]|nr:SLBB domain-containing protein [Steroidobacteraceae bacterium]
MTRYSRFQVRNNFWLHVVLVTICCLVGRSVPAAGPPAPQTGSVSSSEVSVPSLALGAGDAITIDVFGQPDMNGLVSIADDGTIRLPLVGSVAVAGLSTAQAGQKIEKALVDGGFLVKPHVSVTLTTPVSQLVSILGEVRTPGRYQVNANSTIFQILALAGGVTADGADTIFLIHTDSSGKQQRTPIDLKGFSSNSSQLPTTKFKGGDSIFVPRADKFYIYGEVMMPNSYKLEPGMTVVEAIARAGGLTVRGSDRRVEIKRKGPNGKQTTFGAKQDTPVQPDDVIRVKESIF